MFWSKEMVSCCWFAAYMACSKNVQTIQNPARLSDSSSKLLKIIHVVVYPFKIRDQGPHEVFAVIFDDSVYLHGVVETNEAPELSFDLFRILFRAIIISTMRNYLSKNSHTHPIKIDQTRIHAMHFM